MIENDVRVELRRLYEKAKETIKTEKCIAIETVLLIGQLKDWNAASNLYLFEDQYIKSLGLTPDQYYKRLSAYHAIQIEPILLDLLKKGKTHISHLALMGSKITKGNAKKILAFIPGKSKREIEAFLSCITPDGKLKDKEHTVDIRLTLPVKVWEKIDRAREILRVSSKTPSMSEVISTAFDDLLHKRDPMLKAERALERTNKKDQKIQVAQDLPKEQQVEQQEEKEQVASEATAPGPNCKSLKPNKAVMNNTPEATAPGRKNAKKELQWKFGI